MSEINDGGPAFPTTGHTWVGGVKVPTSRSGMSLRAYFAGQAMQGMISHHGDPHIREEMAVRAVASADALIAELRKEPA